MITALIALGPLHRLDKLAQDQLFQQPGVTDTNILINGIDGDGLDLPGSYNTWDRSAMAATLEAMAAGPDNLPAVVAVAVDVLCAGYTSDASDERMASAAKALGCAVTGTMAVFGSSIAWENGRAAAMNASAVAGYEHCPAKLR